MSNYVALKASNAGNLIFSDCLKGHEINNLEILTINLKISEMPILHHTSATLKALIT